MNTAVAFALVAGFVLPAQSPVPLVLPTPTGPHAVGTVALHLVDRSRTDPFTQAPRELMISLWYPARDADRYPVTPWLPSGAFDRMLADDGIPAGAVRAPMTHGRDGAPVEHADGRLPVVLYSHGNDSTRADTVPIVEELASRGYLVVTIDHTFDDYVEFPDGRVLTPAPDGPQNGPVIYRQRIADTRFVLDQLTAIDAGADPDVDHHPLPPGLRGAMDLCRVGMMGYSAGGADMAGAMVADSRITAGLSLDGAVTPDVAAVGLDRPYLLMGIVHSRADDPDLAALWSRLRGWRGDVRMQQATHVGYSVDEVLIPQLAPVLGWSEADVVAQIGTLPPDRAIAVQQAYPLAFFDLQFRHRGHLLDGPSPRFPDMRYFP
jgi:dienelactone hydrolase